MNRSQPVLGYTDRSTVKLDFDDESLKTVKYWAFRATRWFRLRGFIILTSNKNHYHVVFDRKVSWEDNLSALGWFSVLSHNPKLKDYLVMQCVKRTSTLRVAPKDDKPAPRIVFRHGIQDNQIRIFLKYRTLIKRIQRSFKNAHLFVESGFP